MSTGQGYGKLLLFGEHAAVYGYPALGVALPLSTTATWSPSADAFDDATDRGAARQTLRYLHEIAPPDRPRLDALCAKLPHTIGQTLRTGRLRIDSKIPRERGFGSSAALCVALCALADNLRHPAPQQPPATDRTRVWNCAHRLECLFHGTPSGIDTGLAAHGGLRAFYCENRRAFPPIKGVLPRTTPITFPNLYLLFGSVARTASTHQLVAGIHQRHNDPATWTHLKALGDCAHDAIRLVTAPQPANTITALGELANRAHTHLRALTLTIPPLEQCLHIARENGAVGGKMSGAGGGGAFYSLFADRPTMQSAARRLQTHARPDLLFQARLNASSLEILR